MTDDPVACGSCGAELDVGAKFCAACGAPRQGLERATTAEVGRDREAAPTGTHGAQPTVAAPSPDNPYSNLAYLMLGGAGLIVLGSMLTWASASSAFGDELSVAGTKGGGQITIVLGIVIGLLAGILALGNIGPKSVIWSLIAASIVLLVCLVNFGDIGKLIDEAETSFGGLVSVTSGVGLWLVTLGSIVAAVGCVMTLRRKHPVVGLPALPST